MSEEYIGRRPSFTQRTGSISEVVFRPRVGSINQNCRINSGSSVQRPLSTVSQVYLPNGSEYYPQERVPPTGPEVQQAITVTYDDDENADGQTRISVLETVFESINGDLSNHSRGKQIDEKTRQILFIIEPIIGGLILFPLIVLFWEAGWNLVLIILNYLNKFSSDYYVRDDVPNNIPSYT